MSAELFENGWDQTPKINQPSSIRSSESDEGLQNSPEKSSSNYQSSTVVDKCLDCGNSHYPCRLVICVEGTWMDPDGSIVQHTGNTTNIFRIYQLLPREVKFRDANGKIWIQKRAEIVKGVGTSDGFRGIIAGLAGRGDTGCDEKIKMVYKECCKLCPSKDEIIMFGFSRGAFIIRAVAVILQHLGALRMGEEGFDTTLAKAMAVWRDLRTNIARKKHTIESFRTQHTRNSPRIHFLGAFDTVKAFNDSGVNDIGLPHNIYHVRHAMALFENRKAYKLERFSLAEETSTYDGEQRSSQEAWFAGVHGDIGGACEDDGLALWPLQWMLSEAQKVGLVLEFTATQNSNTHNPSHLIFPSVSKLGSSVRLPKVSEQLQSISLLNGIEVSIDDLSEIFETPGFTLRFATRKKWLHVDRQIFDNGKLIGRVDDKNTPFGTFVHPSVFIMDNKNADMVRAINMLPYAEILREQELFVCETHREYWNVTNRIARDQSIGKPRILICGSSGVGKSSLINEFLGESATEISHGAKAGEHNINLPVGGKHADYLLHDSNGWQSGETLNFEQIQIFLKERRSCDMLKDQLHCVWFCSSLENRRITQTDERLLKLDFGGVPVILVFLKLDTLYNDEVEHILKECFQQNPELEKDYAQNNSGLYGLPEPHREKAKAKLKVRIESAKKAIIKQWEDQNVKPEVLVYEFVSTRIGYRNSIEDLKQVSEKAMTGPRISKIHAEVQRNYMDKMLETAVNQFVDLWEKWKPSVVSTSTYQYVVSQFREKVILAANNVFQYEGYQSTIYSDLIGSLIHSSVEESNLQNIISISTRAGAAAATVRAATVSIFGTAAATVGAAAVATVGAATVAQVGTAAAATVRAATTLVGTSMAGSIAGPAITVTVATISMAQNHNIARKLINECVDVLLIFERIYWYHGRHINEHFVRGACCDYLKYQPAIHAKVDSKSLWLLPKEKVKEIMINVVKEFRYKDRVTELISESDGMEAMPGSFPQNS